MSVAQPEMRNAIVPRNPRATEQVIESGTTDIEGVTRIGLAVAERLRALGGSVELVKPAADMPRITTSVPEQFADTAVALFRGRGTAVRPRASRSAQPSGQRARSSARQSAGSMRKTTPLVASLGSGWPPSVRFSVSA